MNNEASANDSMGERMRAVAELYSTIDQLREFLHFADFMEVIVNARQLQNLVLRSTHDLILATRAMEERLNEAGQVVNLIIKEGAKKELIDSGLANEEDFRIKHPSADGKLFEATLRGFSFFRVLNKKGGQENFAIGKLGYYTKLENVDVFYINQFRYGKTVGLHETIYRQANGASLTPSGEILLD